MAKDDLSPEPTSESPLFAYHPLLNRILFGLAMLGVLVVVHLAIQQGRGFDQGCWGFNPDDAASAAVFDCALVTESSSGTLLGLSNVVWGLGFYLGVAALSAAMAFAGPGRRKPLKLARMVLIGGGFLYAVFLVYEQFFTIGELCALCLTSAAITTTIFIVQVVDLVRPARLAPLPTARPAYFAALAGVVVLLIGADFAYFNALDVAPAEEAVPAQTSATQPASGPRMAPAAEECRLRTDVPRYEDYEALIQPSDPVKGNPDAAVTVIEYFDPNCPHCKLAHPIMEAVARTYSDQARFVYIPFMIWPDRSMNQVAALYEAARQGRFSEMLDAQFEQQQASLSNEELRAIASEIGMDADEMIRRIESGFYEETILARKQEAAATGITGMPSVFVNGRLVETLSADCLGIFIEEAAATSEPAMP